MKAVKPAMPWFGRTPTTICAAVAAVMVLGSLSGCSSFYRKVSDFQEGWRTAEVVEIGTAADLRRKATTDCRKTASASQLAASRFAVISYRMGTRQHGHIVLVDEGLPLRVGDVVRTNILRCGTPIEAPASAAKKGN